MAVQFADTAIRTTWREIIAEGTTPLLSMQIVDEDGVAIPSLSTLTLTLHREGAVINGRDKVDVLSSFSDGTISWRFEPEDTEILDDTKTQETHVALIEWTWDSGNRAGKHEIVHVVRNLAGVP